MPQLLHYLRVDKNSKLGDDAKAKSLIQNGSIDDTNNSRAINDNTIEESHELPKELECIPDSNIIENIKDEDIDWGTIDIYTCTASCSPSTQLELSGESSSYLLETVQMQTPVLFHRRRKL